MASEVADERMDAESAGTGNVLRDSDIVEFIRGGQLVEAFDLVMRRYEAKVYRLCLSYVRSPAIAQDAAQESLVRVWRALAKYNGRASLSTWIYAITRNWCLTSLSATRRNVSLSEADVQAEVDLLTAPDLQATQDRGQVMRQLVDELPESTRRTVALYYFEEQSVSEVAERTGLPVGTIKTHLFRARAQLLARLEALGLADPHLWFAAGDRHGQ
jgi:RNA polymerase sigma-70 factor (ECF subfamily)